MLFTYDSNCMQLQKSVVTRRLANTEREKGWGIHKKCFSVSAYQHVSLLLHIVIECRYSEGNDATTISLLHQHCSQNVRSMEEFHIEHKMCSTHRYTRVVRG